MVGEHFNLTELGRRNFLTAIAGGLTGTAAIQTLVKTAFGKEPEGIPIVMKCDRVGKPAEVKYISKKRYHRFDILDKITPSYFGKEEYVTGFSLEKVTDGDRLPRIVVCLKNNTRSIRKRFPKRVAGVPLVFEESDLDHTLLSGCRTDKMYSTLEGNIEIGGIDNNSAGFGTLSFVGKDGSTSNDVAVTAQHVMGHIQNEHMYQPSVFTVQGNPDATRRIGDRLRSSPLDSSGYDLTVYELHDDEQSDVGGTVESSQADIVGTWTFNGLQESLSQGYEIDVEFAGAQTCHASTKVIAVRKNANLKHEARYEHTTLIKGDSGGPFVTDSGYLTGTLTGEYNWGSMFGPTAAEALSHVNVQV